MYNIIFRIFIGNAELKPILNSTPEVLAGSAIREWTEKCNVVKRLDSNFKYAIRNAIKSGYLPLNFENLKNKNNQLYSVLITA